MGNTLGTLERGSILSQVGYHPPYVVPGNNVAWFATGQTGVTIGSPSRTSPFNFTLAMRSAGVPVVPCLVVTLGATFSSGDQATFVLTGKDENYVPITEELTIVGTGATPLNTFFGNLYSVIDTFQCVGGVFSNGGGSGETFQLGSGDAANVRAQNVHPKLLASQVSLLVTNSGTGSTIQPTATVLNGRALVIPTTNVNMRVASVWFPGVDFRSMVNM